MNNVAPVELDFIARLAAAWDGRGSSVLTSGECAALWALAYLQPYDRQPMWQAIAPDQRRRLVHAARVAIEFGRACEAVFSG